MTNNPLRVLVVEDDVRSSRTLAKMLREDGDIVEVLNDGAIAIGRLSRAPVPDVLLVDYRLPNADGLAVAKYAQTLNPKPHVVMITSYPEVMARMEPDHPPFVLLTKPLSYKDLRRELDRVRLEREEDEDEEKDELSYASAKR